MSANGLARMTTTILVSLFFYNGTYAKTSTTALKGSIKIDGSSTVYPITEAVAEEFQKSNRNVRVTVGTSGTGGGFKKFTAGETDISNASRPIKGEEADKAKSSKIDYVELEVAIDGLSVVVNKSNPLNSITVEQLKKIWQPGSKVKLWSDVDKTWPKQPLHLYGPGPDSGTFDYFTEAINGKAKESRADYTPSEDDNVLVRGVSKDTNAMGYFGYEYYAANKDKQPLKALAIDNGKGPVTPTYASIEKGEYPLSRPLFIYVSRKSAERPEMVAFVDFYLKNAAKLAKEVGAVPLPATKSETVLAKWQGWLKAKKTTANKS